MRPLLRLEHQGTSLVSSEEETFTGDDTFTTVTGSLVSTRCGHMTAQQKKKSHIEVLKTL